MRSYQHQKRPVYHSRGQSKKTPQACTNLDVPGLTPPPFNFFHMPLVLNQGISYIIVAVDVARLPHP